MTDVFSKEVRSYIMSRIRGKHTKPEKIMKRYLESKRFKFKQHCLIAGFRVDFALPRRKVAIFIDGCFWHVCPKCFRRPKSNTAYWKQKMRQNVSRDKRIDAAVMKAGWKILHVWEHQLKPVELDALFQRYRFRNP